MFQKIKVPVQVERVFTAVQTKISSNAIIAGGYVRDKMFEKIFHDVDIFVSVNPSSSNNVNHLNNVYDLNFWKRFVNPLSTHGYFNDDYIKHITGPNHSKSYKSKSTKLGNTESFSPTNLPAVWELKISGIIFQVIFTRINPKEFVEKYFDIGFCKCWWDKRQLRMCSDFIRDAQHQTLTIVGEDMTLDEYEYARDVHAVRIKQKYPNFTIYPNVDNLTKFETKQPIASK